MCARTTWPTEIKLCIVGYAMWRRVLWRQSCSPSQTHTDLQSPCCTIRSRANTLCKIVLVEHAPQLKEHQRQLDSTYGTRHTPRSMTQSNQIYHGNQTMLGVNSNKSHHSSLYVCSYRWSRWILRRDPLAVTNLLICLPVSWLQFTCKCICCSRFL